MIAGEPFASPGRKFNDQRGFETARATLRGGTVTRVTERRELDDNTPEQRADEATVHAFLNSYLRETDSYEIRTESVAGVGPGAGGLLYARLPAQGIDLFAPLIVPKENIYLYT